MSAEGGNRVGSEPMKSSTLGSQFSKPCGTKRICCSIVFASVKNLLNFLELQGQVRNLSSLEVVEVFFSLYFGVVIRTVSGWSSCV